MSKAAEKPDLDAVVVGAGFAGLYMLHKLRGQGMSVRVMESANGVGGTWYWNRYPGARCDIISPSTTPTASTRTCKQEWEWSERYATQPEILRYLNHVADRFDLRRDIQFEPAGRRSRLGRERPPLAHHDRRRPEDHFTARHYIMATGLPLSSRRISTSTGLDDFMGEVYHFTGRWPHEGGRLHRQACRRDRHRFLRHPGDPGDRPQAAKSLTVFQRTPNFSIPARNGPLDPDFVAEFEKDPDAYREAARNSLLGVPGEMALDSAMAVSEEERQRRYEDMWQKGTLHSIFAAFGDLIINPASNEAAAEFVRNKIRSDRQRPGGGRDPLPQGLSLRHQAPLPGRRLFRGLQPAERDPGRPE